MKHYLIFLMLPALLLAAGCTIISNDSNTNTSGTEVSDQTLSQVEVGKTTKEWLVAALGPADSVSLAGENTEILKYRDTRTTSKRSGILIVFDSESKREESETVFFEFQDGILQRYWKSED
jgi:hypothetical protein